MRQVIYFPRTTTHEQVRKIRQRFGIRGITVNGESEMPKLLSDKDRSDFQACVDLKLITIRNKT